MGWGHTVSYGSQNQASVHSRKRQNVMKSDDGMRNRLHVARKVARLVPLYRKRIAVGLENEVLVARALATRRVTNYFFSGKGGCKVMSFKVW
jgi:hypothetical protein